MWQGIPTFIISGSSNSAFGVRVRVLPLFFLVFSSFFFFPFPTSGVDFFPSRWPNGLQSHTTGDWTSTPGVKGVGMSSQICDRRCGAERHLSPLTPMGWAMFDSWQLSEILSRRSFKGHGVWIMSNFPWICVYFFLNHTHILPSLALCSLARRSGRKKKKGYEWGSGVDIPISQKIMRVFSMYKHTHTRWAFIVGAQTQANRVSSPYFHVFWPCMQCTLIQPSHTPYTLDCNKQSKSNAATTNEGR